MNKHLKYLAIVIVLAGLLFTAYSTFVKKSFVINDYSLEKSE